MILILTPDARADSPEYKQLMAHLANLPGISTRVHSETGAEQTLTEVHLIGSTKALPIEDMQSLPCVDKVVRISEEYRVLGRHKNDDRPTYFDYNGVCFGQDTLNVFAPRTSPYSFQGHGKDCLPYVFDLAGKYGIKVIAMEITHESHVNEIHEALNRAGNPTGVMLQIGTRNTQNFELLKIVGRQQDFPVLIKRGFGITLDESLNAAEYLASEGNRKVVFGLRGMKTNTADPHRNFVDFAHVPVIKRLTRMPVCIDPSHSVGARTCSPDGILDIMQVTAQGVIAGANMILADFHPVPSKALVDGPQALTIKELPHFLEDISIARRAYEQRAALVKRYLDA